MRDRLKRGVNNRKDLVPFPAVMLLLALGIALAPSFWMWAVAFTLWLFLFAAFRPGWIVACFAFGLIGFVILESAILLFMIRDGLTEEPVTGQETLIVPGAGVDGMDPSYYLRLRLDEAGRLLKEHPEMPVIVTGYQAEGAQISEARAMKDYLMKQGIREDRITEEDRAHDTIRNFEYSAAIIAERRLAPSVIIVTNDFHSFRCSYLAERNGLIPVSRPVQSPTPDLFWFLLREAGSWIKVQLHFGLAG